MAGARPDTWMPLYIGDYLADTMHLSHAQHGIYFLLIMAYWRNGGPIVDDPDQLAAIAKCSAQEWRKNLPIISKFFHIDRGLWSHKRIDAELEDAVTKTQERSKSGKEGARKRWQPHGNAMAEPLANGVAEPIANVWQNDAPSPSPSPLLAASKQISDSLPSEWGEHAAAERAKRGLPEANLSAEWDRFLNKVGDEPTLERWVGWALKANGSAKSVGNGKANGGLPEQPWPQRCRSWLKGMRWDDGWGPPPGQPGCLAPADLVIDVLRQVADRQKSGATA